MKQPNMPVNLFSSDRFHYYGDYKSFVAERSDLDGVTVFAQLYDDACDVGFQMESVKTGNKRYFRLEKEKKDDEGDTISWVFRMMNPDGSDSEVTCEIFND